MNISAADETSRISPGDRVAVTTASWRRMFTVKTSTPHRTVVVGERGAERVLVRDTDGQWSIFAYGRDRPRARPCEIVVSAKFLNTVTLADEDEGGLPSHTCHAAGLDFAAAVRRETNAIADMLIRKNAAYGNSALDPVRIFSQADAVEQIRVRIDDKLSRLKRGSACDDEDTVGDLIGYLVLLRVAEGER